MVAKTAKQLKSSKAAKSILLSVIAVIFGVIAFMLLYNSCHDLPWGAFVSIFGFFVILSALCAAEFITTLFRYGTIKYMATAAIVTAIELVPLPFIWVYSSLAYDPDTAEAYFRSMWRNTAVIFLIILLMIAGVNFLKRRYRIKISVEKK